MKTRSLFGLGVLISALASGCSVYDESLLEGAGGGTTSGTSAGGAGGGSGGAGSGSGGAGGATGSGGQGGGPMCQSPADCPGADTECQTRTCEGGVCGVANTPAGTALAQQTAGDCVEAQCDGMGGATDAPLGTDIEDDAKECTVDTCNQGSPVHTPQPESTPCAQGGGQVCTATGDCVECIAGSQCPSLVCTPQHQCATPQCDDLVQNGMETDVDCGGNCPPCATGLMCGGNNDCIGGLCTGSTCQPTCSDTVKNNAETDVDCGGPTCGGCDVDQMCLAGTDCLSGRCNAAGLCQHRILISEVRSRGPGGATDELIELYNPTSMPVVLDAQWKIEGRNSSGTNYTTRWTGSGATLPPHGHYLIGGSGYVQMPAKDASLSSGITDASSVRLTRANDVIDALCYYYNATTQMDYQNGVGFTCEGTPIDNPTGTSNVDMSMERLPGGAAGNGADTDDNTADFAPIGPALPQNLMSAPTP